MRLRVKEVKRNRVFFLKKKVAFSYCIWKKKNIAKKRTTLFLTVESLWTSSITGHHQEKERERERGRNLLSNCKFPNTQSIFIDPISSLTSVHAALFSSIMLWIGLFWE